MKKLVFLFSAITAVCIFGADDKPFVHRDIKPTDYVMSLVRKSGTTFSGSPYWKHLQREHAVTTNYVHVEKSANQILEYSGITAALWSLSRKFNSQPEHTIKANFKITREEGCKSDSISITSHIEDTQDLEHTNASEIQERQKVPFNDAFTQCSLTHTFTKPDRTYLFGHVTFISNCKTIMPLGMFKRETGE